MQGTGDSFLQRHFLTKPKNLLAQSLESPLINSSKKMIFLDQRGSPPARYDYSERKNPNPRQDTNEYADIRSSRDLNEHRDQIGLVRTNASSASSAQKMIEPTGLKNSFSFRH
jgi:hypothetical protein